MTTCAMPACVHPPTVHNRAGQDVCKGHQAVVVSGSWFNDRHGEEVSE